MPDLSQAKLSIPLGTLCGNGAHIKFEMVITADGIGRLYLWTSDMKKGLQSTIDESGLADLKKIVLDIEAMIAQLKGDGRLVRIELRQ